MRCKYRRSTPPVVTSPRGLRVVAGEPRVIKAAFAGNEQFSGMRYCTLTLGPVPAERVRANTATTTPT